MSPRILAHAGGVDEALVFLVPILMFAGLAWWSSRRRPQEPTDHNDGDE